jgi:hypothetical protein
MFDRWWDGRRNAVPDFASHQSQPLFDPTILGEALKRRFPVTDDDAFSALLASLDAVEDHAPRSREMAVNGR